MKEFYEELYTSDELVHFEYKNDTGICIDQQDKKLLDKDITLDDLKHAIKETKRGKAPGPDGLTIEFYIVFFEKLGKILLDALLYGLQQGILHESARKGILSLIPKRGKDSRKIQHNRPLTLLNVDLKILEKVFAERLKVVLDKLINRDQKGFLQNRKIFSNIRRVLDIVEIAERHNIEGVILSLDFFKCFDQVEIKPMIKAMKFFGIGSRFRRWVKACYTDTSVKVINNGMLSEKISTTRGLRQGAPCSPYYFLICAEILAILLRENKEIKGFNINNFSSILGQFADDMDMYLLFEKGTINNVVKTLNSFQQNLGFKVNYDKTTVYRIGSLRNSEAKIYTQPMLNWSNNPIEVLGVRITHDKGDLARINYENIIQKSTGILTNWRRRNLSLYGKILIVNTLISSLFVYKMYTVPSMSLQMIKQLNKICSDFIWNGRKPKIAYEKLQNTKKLGGMNLVDFGIKDDSLKISWIKILQEDTELAKIVYEQLNPILGEWIWKVNLNTSDINKLFKNDFFWKDVLRAWSKLNFKSAEEMSNSEIANQIIWFNTCIRRENKPFLIKKAFLNGLTTVSCLITPNGKQIPAETICSWYDIDVMCYNTIWASIPSKWKHKLVNEKLDNVHDYLSEKVLLVKNVASWAYRKLLADENKLFGLYINWQSKIHTSYSYKEFLKLFGNIYKITNHSKYRSFQYRILHNAIIFNDRLSKWNIKDNDSCTYCKEKETMLHFYVECKKAKEFWVKVTEMCRTMYNTNTCLTAENIIFNTIEPNAKHVSNFIVLVAKTYMYSQRCLNKDYTFREYKIILERCEQNELWFARKNNKVAKH